ncbi:glutathione S-transferase [Paraphoma chrysanthemicola]|nr:glutathione S-transferase [Paraphoma chrysanthemicola]
MAIIVYGASYSTRTQGVLLVLRKLCIEYVLQHVDMQKGEHCSPEFKASHQPFGKLPAIDDAGFQLFESRAIARYLVAKRPGPLSLPSDPVSLGNFEQEASVEHVYFETAVSNLGFEKIFKKMSTGQDADEATVVRLEGELIKVLDYYEGVLRKQKWLAGSELSLVDVFVIPWLNFLVSRLDYQALVDARPNILAWWRTASQDKDWKKVIGSD